MKISVCLTLYNEEKSIPELFTSLYSQTVKPEEVIVVDSASTDNSIKILRHYQKKYPRIKLLVEKCSRARGRNLAVGMAGNEIIAVTDGGCIPHKDWLEKITRPFENRKVGVVAGFYTMVSRNDFQKALSVYLGTLPDSFGEKFLPSTRSIAFRKEIFEKISGFPEMLKDTAEDNLFAVNLIRNGIKITRAKDALVDWEMPADLKSACLKFYRYSYGDAQSGIWIHPTNGLMSHNFKSLAKIIRYLGFFVLLLLSLRSYYFLLLSVFLFTSYCNWAFRKVYGPYKNVSAGLWGIIIQFASDISVIAGFISGLINI